MVTPKNTLKRNPIQLPWNTMESAEDDAVDEGTEVDEGFLVEVVKPDDVTDTAEEPDWEVPVGEARGAVDCPLIWLETSVLKVPVISSKVNLAENAIAGYWGCLASLRERDSMRMKYSPLFGPMVGSGVILSELTLEISTLALRV